MLKRLLSPAARPVGLPLPLTWTSVMGFGEHMEERTCADSVQAVGIKGNGQYKQGFPCRGTNSCDVAEEPKTT